MAAEEHNEVITFKVMTMRPPFEFTSTSSLDIDRPPFDFTDVGRGPGGTPARVYTAVSVCLKELDEIERCVL